MTTASQTPGDSADLEALVALAQREHLAGRLAEAAVAYQKILALRPDIAEVHNNLGNVLLGLGKVDQAADQFLRATALKPSLYQAHNSLGDVYHQQRRLDLAAERYRQAIALNPNFAEAHSNLGLLLGHQGHLVEAATHCERATALNPGLYEAQNNLGNIYRKQGKLDQAAARYRQAIALRPDLAGPHNNLGDLFKQQHKFAEAQTEYEQALALEPGVFRTHSNLGTMLRRQNKLDEAVAQYQQALALQPDAAEVYNRLGNIFWQQGKFDEATANFDQALALKPDYAETHFDRADLKTYQPGDPDLAALEALAAEPVRLPPAKMVYIHFALGKALQDTGDNARAFQHLLQGNALKRRQIGYDEAVNRRKFQLLAETFDAALFDHFAGSGDPSSLPIFVLGMPRSGSTLIEQILASHPQVQAAGELLNLQQVTQMVTNTAGRPLAFPQFIRGLAADNLRQMGQAYLAGLPPLAEGKTRIVDKAPTNFFLVGLIRLILPNARIIHTVRDPVDTCFSCFSTLFAQGQPYSFDLAELGRFYRRYQELMAHWRSVLPAGTMLDVSYEDVVDNLEEQARRLIDYCGLAWDDRCLSFHETSRPIMTASGAQVRRPVYRSSLARWRRFEAYLGPLLAELGNRPAASG